ncbi:MAG: GNAT family N-acetyltransferase [Gemmatimonadota bacterium]|nr:GNAT family N-acetyltransferase [Gemmatimonadota bacterium]MDH3424289.1 GNAT family N-acetyltransferase [Gemmatimonadota bacterium]
MTGRGNARPVQAVDAEAWIRLRTELWPESPHDHPVEVTSYFEAPPGRAACFVVEDGSGAVVGFAEVGLRSYAEGCVSSPVGYLEGIYVAPGARRVGHARSLAASCEAWSQSMGCREFASDRAIDNEVSSALHEALGFEEAARLVCYRKAL